MLSAKSEYACVALGRLALEHAGGRPVQGRRIAAEEGVPEGFLVQILQELKRLGLVTSTRGAAGGYRLARDPESMSLGEAIDLVEGPPSDGANLANPSPIGERVAELVARSELAARESLRGVSLADIARRAVASEAMYHI